MPDALMSIPGMWSRCYNTLVIIAALVWHPPTSFAVPVSAGAVFCNRRTSAPDGERRAEVS